MGNVLVSPLNWGLGHATRDIPLIRALLAHNHDVTIAAHGNALAALREEFPDLSYVEFADYPIWYSGNRYFLPKFVASFPLIIKALSNERKQMAHILEKDNFDLIISDNRLGVYSEKIPSVFISHQLHNHLPWVLWPLELAAIEMNAYVHEKYRHVVVPDNPPGPLSLAGKLSRAEADATLPRAYYAGILTSMRRREVRQDLEYLVMVSGPEPQRTLLEEILLPQVQALDVACTVLLGSPANRAKRVTHGTCTVIPYASTEEKEILMNRAQFIISRSGYTSVMEIAELNKNKVLFIPTPGQTEQEYLSWYYEKKHWVKSVSQYEINLPNDIESASHYSGLPEMPKTAENVERLYHEIFAQYL